MSSCIPGLKSAPLVPGWVLRDVVKRLRCKLGDDAAESRYIVPELRVGYRMAARDHEKRNHADSAE